VTAIHYVGEMTIERWRSPWSEIGARVLFCGADITDTCRWFDTNNGLAEVLELDGSGRPFLNGDDVAVKLLSGDVVVMVP